MKVNINELLRKKLKSENVNGGVIMLGVRRTSVEKLIIKISDCYSELDKVRIENVVDSVVRYVEKKYDCFFFDVVVCFN